MEAHEKLQQIETELNKNFVEREDEIHGLTLSILSDNNILFLGPPGVGKSLLAQTWAQHIEGANYFSRLLSPTTKDEEVMGAPSIKKLVDKEKMIRNTTNKLPEAHIAFLDEIWKASSALTNSLLKVLNERKFDNGEGDEDIPLFTVVAASNELPDADSGLEAAVDRFVLKYKVEPVQEPSNVIELMGEHLNRQRNGKDVHVDTTIHIDELREARQEVKQVEVSEGILKNIEEIVSALYDQHIYPSARTYSDANMILQAEAYLNGRDEVIEEDLEILRHCYWDEPEEQSEVFTLILDRINPEKHKVVELYEDSRELYEEVMSLEDEDEVVKRGVEAARKLKNAKKDLGKLIKKMKEKNKDTTEPKKYERKIAGYLETIYEECVGVSIGEDEDIEEEPVGEVVAEAENDSN